MPAAPVATNAAELEALFREADKDTSPLPSQKADVRKPGRPRIVHNPRSIRIEVDGDLLTAFDECAEKKGLSRAEAIREAMRALVDSHRATDRAA